jgi:RimJ/RimL family protein N-acetyltransferase
MEEPDDAREGHESGDENRADGQSGSDAEDDDGVAPAFLHGERVVLSPADEADLEFARRLINRPAVRKPLRAFEPKTLDDERAWLESLGDGDYGFVVRADGERVGIAGLHEKHRAWGVTELGYFFDPAAWGNGYATDAARQLARYAFDELRYAKVVAPVLATNEASRRVLEKAGFEREGVLRDEAFVDGERVDLHRYGLLATAYREEA